MSSKWAAEEESDSDEEVQPVKSSSVPAPVADIPPQPPVRESRPKQSGPQELIGFMTDIRLSAHRVDIVEFFQELGIKFSGIEPLKHNNEFAGKVKVYLDSEEAFDKFIALDGTEFMGQPIHTREWIDNARRKDYGARPNRGEQRNDRGDRGEQRERGDYRRERGTDRPRSDYRRGEGNEDRGDRGQYRGGRQREDRRPPHGDSNAENGDSAAPPAPPAERPKLNLAPRTKPLEEIGKPEARADIFGGGRPHDDTEYEERRKKVLEVKGSTSTPAVNSSSGPSATNASTVTVATTVDNKTVARTANDDDGHQDGGKKRERRVRDRKDKKKGPASVDIASTSKDEEVAAALAAEELGNLSVQDGEGDFTVVERNNKRRKDAAGSAPTTSAPVSTSNKGGKKGGNNSNNNHNSVHNNSNNNIKGPRDGNKDRIKGQDRREGHKKSSSNSGGATPTAASTATATSASTTTGSTAVKKESTYSAPSKPANAYAGLDDSDQDD